MIVLPAIDLKDGKCVRLVQGDYATAQVVAADAVETARQFEAQGARWLHMVDLDGAKSGRPKNQDIVFDVRKNVNMHIEIGGGIRDMDTVEFYLEQGIDRVILGSAALKDKSFVKSAIERYGRKIAIGIDCMDGKVAAEGWLDQSEVDYIELAREMDALGASYIIFTDIRQDGTLNGPNLTMLEKINNAVGCNIIASGGVSNIKDILNVHGLGLYGVIAGKAIYSNNLDLRVAVIASQKMSHKKPKNKAEIDDNLERYFRKSDLIPAIIQEESTGKVLMMAYMNRESLEESMHTGYTWFYSRSRQQLWNKGETSGNRQKIISITADCDDDTLLVKVVQSGPACHTGNHSCFFKDILHVEDGGQ